MQRVGSRRQVWNKTAKQTSGGLTRSELFQDKYGNIKSKRVLLVLFVLKKRKRKGQKVKRKQRVENHPRREVENKEVVIHVEPLRKAPVN